MKNTKQFFFTKQFISKTNMTGVNQRQLQQKCTELQAVDLGQSHKECGRDYEHSTLPYVVKTLHKKELSLGQNKLTAQWLKKKK